MITVYSLPDCPKCRELKTWLKSHDIPFTEKELGAEAIAEARCGGVFDISAPFLQVGDEWYGSTTLWKDEKIQTEMLVMWIYEVC